MRLSSFAAIVACLSIAGCPEVPEPDRDLRLAAERARASAATSAKALPVASSAAPEAPFVVPVRVTVEGGAMGTRVSLAAFTDAANDEQTLRAKLQKGLDEIRRLEAVMTTWREDAELSRVNQNAGKAAVPVSPETFAVIEKSLWMSKRSEGVFDITFEAMHGLWKFDHDHDDKIPSKAAVDKARRLIDYRKLKLDPDKRTVMLEQEGMRMSLGGIAKGYAVDAAARILRDEGIKSFFAQAGGDLFVQGRKPDGTAWRVGIRDPRGKDVSDYFAMLEVEDHAFSTAGDYERGFVKDKKRYHHIIDPRTGYPATASRSVTIWAKDAFTADAIDDAVFILGPEKGLALVESVEDAGAVIVDAKNKVWVSERLRGKVRLLREPTDAP